MPQQEPRPVEGLNLEVVSELARAEKMTIALLQHQHDVLICSGLRELLTNIRTAQNRCTLIDEQFRTKRQGGTQ